MKTNNSTLVVSTLMALAGVAMTAPTPYTPQTPNLPTPATRRWELPSNIKDLDLPDSININTGTQTNTNTNTNTENTNMVNNGDGNGNSGGVNTSNRNSGNGSNNSKASKSRRRRNLVVNNGDGNANSGKASVVVNKNAGNNAHNTDSHNSVDSHDTTDSHNNQVSTDIDIPPIWRRTTIVNNGDGNANSGGASVKINKDVGNNSNNVDSHDTVDSHNSWDSHNNKVDTSIGFGFKRSTVVNNGDGNANSGGASVVINKDVGNNSHNVDSHDTKDSHNSWDSHNNEVNTDIGFGFKRSTVVNNGDGNANSGGASVVISKNAGNNAHNTDSHDYTDSHDTTDSHNNEVNTDIGFGFKN